MKNQSTLNSENEFKTLAETIPQLVWVSDAQGKSEYFNSRWHDYTGISSNLDSFENWDKIIHPEDQKKSIGGWQRSIKTGKPYEMEVRLRNGKTGEYRWFLTRALPIKDSNKKIVKWFGTSTDIHEQKRNVEAQTFLAKASKKLSSSLNYKVTLKEITKLAVPEFADWCSIELYQQGQVIPIDVAHKDPKKVKWAKELRKKNPPDMSMDTGLPKVLKTCRSEFYPLITDDMLVAAARTKKDLKLMRDIGFTSVMIVPIVINEQAAGAIQFVTTESRKRYTKTDLNMAEELATRSALAIHNSQLYELAQNRERQFKVLYKSNIIGVIYEILDGNIVDANDAFLQMIGYSRKDLKEGKLNWKKLTPPEYNEQTKAFEERIMKDGAVELREKEYIKKDGSQVPVMVGSVLVNKEAKEVLVFVLDITERKKLEQRKDEFIGIASHELKTPLTSIKGYVQILERIIHQMGDDQLNLYVKKTNTYIDRLNSLIADLLDVSKIQAGKLQLNQSSFNFKDLVNDGVDNIQHTNSTHKVIVKGDADFKIKGDKHRLEQVFVNLLTNAIKYSPDGKKIIINIEKKRGEVQVSVRDFGVGISTSDQHKLFQRFYRVEKTAHQFSGLGIGLYISCEIIQRHGGRMWVESKVGKGSTFFFSVPLKQKKEL